MTKTIEGIAAILPSNNLDLAESFYYRLGFRRAADDSDDSYRILTNDQGMALHLTAAVKDWLVPGKNPFGLYLQIEAVDEMAYRFPEELVDGPPRDRAWGMYEFAMADPDGALVRVGWPSRLRNV